MRTYIVTFFNSFNAGAYLQAYALGQVLQHITDAEPTYIDTNARSVNRLFKYLSKQAVEHHQFEELTFLIKERSAFLKALKDFHIEDLATNYEPDDLIVFGSDEIFNVARQSVIDYPALWGEGFDGGYRIAYAPSANGADFSKFKGIDKLAQQLRQFKALSARDASTAESIKRLVGSPVPVVCDPALLLDIEDYRVIQKEPKQSNYLLVYSYGTAMTQEDITEIKTFAQYHGLRLISIGVYLEWCDESLPCGPFEFLGWVDKADYLVTDTFHGSVFATIYGKKFASYGRGNIKVVEYLQAADLQDRDPADHGSLAECLESCNECNYLQSKQLSHLRASSYDYLQQAITAMKNYLV